MVTHTHSPAQNVMSTGSTNVRKSATDTPERTHTDSYAGARYIVRPLDNDGDACAASWSITAFRAPILLRAT